MGTRLHSSKRDDSRRSFSAPVTAALLAVLVVAGGAAAVVALHGTGKASGKPGGTAAHTSRTGPSGKGTHTRPPAPPPPLELVSVSPPPGTSDVPYEPVITVRFSQPVAPGSNLPTLTPSLPGSWTLAAPKTLVFHAEAELPPYSSLHLKVSGGSDGVRDTAGVPLDSSFQASYVVEGASTLRLQQLLAELGYLPLEFVPSSSGSLTAASGDGRTGAPASGAAIDGEPAAADEIPLSPVAGHFAWRFGATPASLESLWTAGEDNVVTRGAVMAFEAEEGLNVDGEAGPAVWHALLEAVAARQLDPAPYDYITVSESSPETLYVWQDGRTLFSVLANTGISEAPTATGTYPVYARYLVTTMSGKNPNGTRYSDPGIPHVAYFNGGDAIHGFIRAGYGYPQSLGCVELTYSDAAQVWPYDQLGTLVSVET